ncbi:(d)CMP kinase [Patescibacteria group bacterium]
MIITISGLPGSGKSTMATRLSRTLGWQQHYMGRLWREMARQKGMTLPELQALAETDQSIDTMVDEKVKKIAQTSDNIIIESRTAYHFVPDSFKMFFKVSPPEGARRIYNDIQHSNQRNEGNHIDSVEAMVKSNEKRMATDRKRYKQYYGIDVFDEKNFDYIIDTTDLTVDEVFKKAYEAVLKELEKK